MSLLQPAMITSAYLKMGILGFQGGGKTKTAGKTAIGLYKYMQSKGINVDNKPVAMFDTETGSDWLIPDFRAANVPFVVAKRRAFADLISVIKEAEAGASILIIDSITHPWRELCESYMRKKGRPYLQMQDWGYLKGDNGWAKFTDLFVNSKLHIIMCGRAGYEFDEYKDEDGKIHMEKVGTKMKTETETGFEPSLLVLMEHVEDMQTGRVKHRATVQKDRSTLLDGAQIDNPDFRDFLPHIERLNLGGDHIGVDTSQTSVGMIPADIRDSRSTHRAIALDEIQSILVLHYPGQSAEDKKRKLELLRKHFSASWTEMEKLMSLEKLRAGYDSLHRELEGKASRYNPDPEPAPEINDSLPDHSAPPVDGVPVGESSSPTATAPPATTTEGKPSSASTNSAPVDEAELLDRYDAQLEVAAPLGTAALQAAVDKLPIEHQAKMAPRIIRKWGPIAAKADKAAAKAAKQEAVA